MRIFLTVFICTVLFAVSQASAHEMKNNGLMVKDSWARATAGPAKAGAVYLTIANMGHETDRLVAVKSDLAKRTEIHTHLMKDGMIKMRHVEAVEVSPGTPTIFQPGGLHIMFMGLNKPFVEGETLPLTLVFEKTGEIDIEFVVQGVSAKSKNKDGHGAHKHKYRS